MKYKLILLTLIGSFWMMVGNVHAQNNMWKTIDIKQTTLNPINKQTKIYQLQPKNNLRVQTNKKLYISNFDSITSNQVLLMPIDKKKQPYFKVKKNMHIGYVKLSSFKNIHFLNIKKTLAQNTVIKLKTNQGYSTNRYGKYMLLKNTKLAKSEDAFISNNIVTLMTSARKKQTYYQINIKQHNYLILKTKATKLVNKIISDDYTDINTDTTLKPDTTLYQFKGDDDDFKIKVIRKIKKTDLNQYTIQELATVKEANGTLSKYYQVKDINTNKDYYVLENQLGDKFEKIDNTTTTILDNPLDITSLINPPTVDNIDAPSYIKAPAEDTNADASYSTSPNFNTKPGHYENKVNTYASTLAINMQPATLKTSLFLPTASAESDDQTSNGLGNMNGFKNVQAVTYDGQQYIYIMVSYGAGTNSGRIIRYDLKAINNDQVKIGELRKIAYKAYRQLRTGKEIDWTRYKKYMKVGPKLRIGHGETLAYDTINNNLWMMVDQQNPDKKYTQKESVLQEINSTTLTPKYTINYTTKDENGKIIKPLHNLTFDNRGNFYSYVYQRMNGTTGIKIYQGQIDERNHMLQLKLVQVIKQNIGTNKQGIFFDPLENELYLESDDTLMKMPVNKLGSLTASDIGYLVFKTANENSTYGREWEGGFFTPSGQGYILMNKGVELLALNK